MFPPSLQKNIQELDRQISLLETECENMESEKKEFTIGPEVSVRELPNKPFITGPVCNTSLFPKREMFPIVPKIYSTHFAYQKPITKFNECLEKNEIEEILKSANPENTTVKSGSKEMENKEPLRKRSISSITEVSESSDEDDISKQKNMTKKASRGLLWSEIFYKQMKVPGLRKNKIFNDELLSRSCRIQSEKKLNQRPIEKTSSDEEHNKVSCNESEDVKQMKESGSFSAYGRAMSKKRRKRSTRTRKNSVNDIPMALNLSKSLSEKEIQCMIWNEEREKNEFLVNLHDSIRTLHLLISDLKTKTSQEKRNEVLSDMQNTLLKISGVKSMNALSDPHSMFCSYKKGRINYVQGEEKEVAQFKKTLFGVKKFCEELTNEKSILSDELSTKTKTIAYLKNKEKEYLSLISSLKFNLEKTKEEAEEGTRTKQNYIILKNKLQEEVKVVEALKKSHAKMQELIESYVMENDQLRTQLKIAKLESHKFNVLLAGRDEEVKKYKEEIEMFQRQISQQLNLLRSKAGVENAMETMNNQTSLFSQTESYLSETTMGKHDFNEQSYPVSSKTSLESTCTDQGNKMNKAIVPVTTSLVESTKQVTASKSGSNSAAMVPKEDTNFDGGELDKVLANSKSLKTSIEEIIQDMSFKSSQTSYNMSQYTMPSTSSENV